MSYPRFLYAYRRASTQLGLPPQPADGESLEMARALARALKEAEREGRRFSVQGFVQAHSRPLRQPSRQEGLEPASLPSPEGEILLLARAVERLARAVESLSRTFPRRVRVQAPPPPSFQAGEKEQVLDFLRP